MKFKSWLKQSAIICFISLIIFNFSLILLSKFIKQIYFSKQFLRVLPAELTYFYSDTYKNFDNYWVILGDSHAFGSGDSFLNNDYNFSIGHHLHNLSNKNINFINVGFPGGGAQANYKNFLNFERKMDKNPEKIIYLFYEGNDLENNIVYHNKFSNFEKLKYKIKIYLPIIYIMKRVAEVFYYEIKFNLLKKKVINKNNITNYYILNNSIKKINTKLQSPPIELDKINFNKSLDIFFSSLNNLKFYSNDILIVYLPSPTTVLDTLNPIYIQTYFETKKLKYFKKKELNQVHNLLVTNIEKFSKKNNFYFLNLTKSLKKIAKTEEIYGPIDFRHYNANGYQLISKEIFKHISKEIF